ncbi:MAG: hypothetical protein WCO51_09705 [bacterium]
MFGVLFEGIRVFSQLDSSYYLNVALITVLAIPVLLIGIYIYSTLFSTRGKLYKYLIVIGAILLFLFWPIGIITVCLGLFFRHKAIAQQKNSRCVVKLVPNRQPQNVDINHEKSGWKVDGEYYINRLSSIKFPQQFGGILNLTSILVYDDLGENCSIGYQSIIPNFYVTAYIYTAHSNDLTDAFKGEFENIVTSHPDLSIPSSQEFWGPDTEAVENNLNFADSAFISTALCYAEGAIKVNSFVIFAEFAGNYIKVRATWPSDTRFPSGMALSTLRGVLIDLTALNRLDIFGINPAKPA